MALVDGVRLVGEQYVKTGGQNGQTGDNTKPGTDAASKSPDSGTLVLPAANSGLNGGNSSVGNNGNALATGNSAGNTPAAVTPENYQAQFMSRFNLSGANQGGNGGRPGNAADTRRGDDAPTIAYIESVDRFHNGAVKDILAESSGQDEGNIQFLNIGEAPPENTNPESNEPLHLDGSLNDAVIAGVSGTYDDVSDNLETILNDPNSQVRTVNVSYGNSNAQIYEGIYGLYTNGDASTKQAVLDAIGLKDTAGEEDVIQHIVDYTDRLVANDPTIAKSRQRYGELTANAKEHGIFVVVASGNNGETNAFLEDNGFRVNTDSDINYLANDNVITVGAIDDRNTGRTNDDRRADFASSGSQVDIAADGVDTFGNDELDGTSFATPQVAGTIDRMLAANPDLTYDQVLRILQDTATDHANIGADAEGAGLLNADAAVEQALALRTDNTDIPPADEIPDEDAVEEPEPSGPVDSQDEADPVTEDEGGGVQVPGFELPPGFEDLFKQIAGQEGPDAGTAHEGNIDGYDEEGDPVASHAGTPGEGSSGGGMDFAALQRQFIELFTEIFSQFGFRIPQ